jgi:hypothetical protein
MIQMAVYKVNDAASLVLAKVSVSPNSKAVPGTEAGEFLAGGIMTWALIACTIAMIAGGAMLAYGKFRNSHGADAMGKGMIALAFIGAIFVLAAPDIINGADPIADRVK